MAPPSIHLTFNPVKVRYLVGPDGRTLFGSATTLINLTAFI